MILSATTFLGCAIAAEKNAVNNTVSKMLCFIMKRSLYWDIFKVKPVLGYSRIEYII